MQNRILLLNVELSGINKYLISQLEERGWEIISVDIPYPKILRWWSLLATFNLDIRLWKKDFSNRLEKLHKTAWTFVRRTKYCQRIIKRNRHSADVILQISGMFSPSLDLEAINIPYVTYNDYTMILSNKYEPWDAIFSEKAKFIKLERELYNNASCIFTTSENTRQSLIKDYGIDEIKVINVGYGVTLEEGEYRKKDYCSNIILFVGLDFERKGGQYLLEAFKKVKQYIPNAKLIIVGPKKQLININQLGVEILGKIRDKDMLRDLYQKASIFVMPTLCEPFGLVFLEAMVNKLACIGTNIDAMPEIIEDGKTGFLVHQEMSVF